MLKTVSITLLLLITITNTAQNSIIKGIVKNTNKEPIDGVAITYLNYGTTTNSNGEYSFNVTGGVEITIVFRHISYTTFTKTVTIPKNKTYRFIPILEYKTEEIDEIIVKDTKKDAQGFIKIDAAEVSKIPGANNGVENILMTLPGVNNNNE